MRVNPLKHPVYDLLPQRTQAKLLSPVSEDKLTWDCFFGLLRAGELGAALARPLKVPDTSFEDARLVLWGFEIREDGASVWEPLREVLSAVENYRDGKPEGQKTEPDVAVVSAGSLLVAECKRRSTLGRCSRFEDSRCPEIHVDRRKRPYCQYWTRGLQELIGFSKPVPATSDPECNRHYQLLRNYMIGDRLAAALGLPLHLMVVKASNSPHFAETTAEVQLFNSAMTHAPKYVVACWNDFRFGRTPDVLSGYAAELPPLAHA
jgi:hypothetical protein